MKERIKLYNKLFCELSEKAFKILVTAFSFIFSITETVNIYVHEIFNIK
jgi:hypothetical protein